MKKLSLVILLVLFTWSKSLSEDFDSKKSCLFGSKIPICNLCCCQDLASVNCNELRSVFYSYKRPVEFEVDDSFFQGIQSTATHLVIDFSSLDITFKLDHNLFLNMINLQKLTLIKISDLKQVPKLENQIYLEEITIQWSDLKQIESSFCLSNSRLKTIDFSYNDLDSRGIGNVFTNCDHLNILDLSYNNLNSLVNFITYVSSVMMLDLKGNKIRQINGDDLDFLIDLIELNLASNKIEVIYENAFYSQNKLRILNLRNNKLTEFTDDDMTSLEFIDLSSNRLNKINTDFCFNKVYLKKVYLSNNKFRSENLSDIFTNCTSLVQFDLENNELTSIGKLFSQSVNVAELNLKGNKITELNQKDFKHLTSLKALILSNNQISYIHKNALDPLRELKTLDLSSNMLVLLPETSVTYASLELFDISDNQMLVVFPDVKQFYELKSLRVHYPYHCCQFQQRNPILEDTKTNLLESVDGFETDDSDLIVDMSNNQTWMNNQSVIVIEDEEEIHHDIITASPIDPNEPEDTIALNIKLTKKKTKLFVCTPEPDPFQPCENLLENWWLRSSVWFISLMGILSNLSVVVFNILFNISFYYSNVDIHVPSFLLTNLAIADSLMSIYLLFIAIKDNTSRSNFGKSALEWQNSVSCNLAGFLSISSTVSSALCLVFITFERYYAIKNSINFNKRISFRQALFVCFLIWLISFTFSFLPLIDINSYSKYAICLPLDTRGNSYQAYVIGLNSMYIISFIFMCVFYAMVFLNTSFRKRKTSITECNDQLRIRNAEDQRLARNILLLLTVNIICWGPIVIFCFYTLIHDNPMNRIYIKLIAVFIIPFNSLINPFLYCLSRKIFRTYIRDYLTKFNLKRSSMRTNLSVKSTFSSYSCKRSSHKSSLITSIHRPSVHRNSNTEKI